MKPDEHRIRMTEFDIRNSLRALATVGMASSSGRQATFEHLLLLHRRVVMAQVKSLDERSKVTGKWSNEEIVVIADALGESRMYPASRFSRKMRLYKRAIESGAPFDEAWNREVRRRKIERRDRERHSWYSETNSDEEEGMDQVEIAEKRGYHREHGDWGRLVDQDGEEVYEDLSRGEDGWLYNDDGTRILRWREEEGPEDHDE